MSGRAIFSSGLFVALWAACAGAPGGPSRPGRPGAPEAAPPRADRLSGGAPDVVPDGRRAPSLWMTAPATPWVVEPLPGAAAPGRPRAPSRVELRLSTLPSEISVAPDGALWLTTRDDVAYRTSGFDAPWQPAHLTCRDPEGSSSMGVCDRVTFFDGSTAIATGYVGRDRAELLRTVDGGRSWARLRFAGSGEWLYDVFVGPGPDEAWMGGSSGRLHHTADQGRTWSILATPFDSRSRLHRIFMAPGGGGIVGALANALRVTTDGGRTWTAIPTPLDQAATSGAVVDEREDDRIDEVALYGGGLLVAQNDRVYASARAPVQWRPLPDLVALAVDRAGQAAYGVTSNGGIARIDAAFGVTAVPGPRIRGELVALSAEGGVLYVMDDSSALVRADAQTVRFSTLQADGDPSAALESVRRAGDALWGVSPHGLYVSRDGGATWTRAWSSDAPLHGVEARSANELFVWSDAGASLFDARARRATPLQTLAGVQIRRVVVAGTDWIALAATGADASTWRSGDAGGTWERIDSWRGWAARDAVSVPDGAVVTFTLDGFVRRESDAVRAVDIEVPCCTSMYFANATVGFLRGYVHHMGDHAWATHDAGATWSPADIGELPYAQVAAFGEAALGVVGRSFSYDDRDRRELQLLRGLTRRRVYVAAEAITDVSVDPQGRVLLELDPSPDTFADRAGRHWIWVHP